MTGARNVVQHWPDRIVAIILFLYVLLAAAYSVVVPIFEAPDEAQHFFFVREIIEGHGLPVQQAGASGRWSQEGSQPPLYYLAGAALTFWTDAGDWADANRRNPYAVQGDPLANGSRNVFLHGPQQDFPWHGTALSVHLLRFVSIFIGALSIIITYVLGRTLFPAQPMLALGASLVHAFLPQFIYISAAVNNDGLAALACGLVLLQTVRVAQGADDVRDDWLLGLFVGLAALTKLSGAAMSLVAVTAVLLAAQAKGRGAWQPTLLRLARVTLAAALVAGWWYARNLILYGDVTGLNRMLAIVGVRNPPPDAWQLLDELEGLRLSFWGLFGWFSILLPEAFYQWFDGVAIFASAGLTLGLIRYIVRRDNGQRIPAFILLPLTAGIVFIGVMRWGTLTPGLQGRLLFPALSAIAILMMVGINAWENTLGDMVGRGKAIVNAPFLVALAFPLLAMITLPVVIAPHYARPEVRAASGVAGITQWKGRDTITLLSAETIANAIHPGDELPVTLIWRSEQKPSQDYTLYVKVYGLDDELIASIDTYPGNGMYPMTDWVGQQEIVDRYSLRLSPAAKAPAYAKVVVGWYERLSGQALAPFSLEGRRIVRPVVARAKVAPNSAPRPPHTLNATFGGQIALMGYDVGPGKLTLYWKALRNLTTDYTVFVHVLDGAGKVVAQSDSPPQNGDYPTSAWSPGDLILDDHALNLPPQAVQLEVGLYDARTSARLPLDTLSTDSVLIPLGR